MVEATGVIIAAAAVAAVALWPLLKILAHAVRQWSYLRHLPGPPATHWLLGQVPDFMSTEISMRLAEWTARYGGVYKLRFFYAFGVVVTDPQLVRAVLQSSKTYVPKDRQLLVSLEVACGSPAMPNILTSSDGDYWRLVRGAWMKCFTSTNLKRVLPILQDICERVTEQIQQQAAAAAAAGESQAEAPAAAAVAAPPAAAGGAAAVAAAAAAGEAAAATTTAADTHGSGGAAEPVAVTATDAAAARSEHVPAGSALINICNVTDRITLDVIGHMSYGRDFGAVDHKRSRYLQLVSGMLALMHEEMDHPLRRLARKVSGQGRSRALLRAEWDATNTAEVMKALAHPPGPHTIAGQLMAVQDPLTQQPLSLQQLKSELVIATLAGFETTSNALSWTLGSLAAHPAAMAALEQELAGAGLLASPDNLHPPRFEWQTLGKLQYLQACIREGLRLFSPAANGSWRLCTTTDIALSKDVTLPRGTPVGIPFFAFGHNPAVYGADVEAFRPERWLVGRGANMNSSSLSSVMGSTDDADSSTTAAAAVGTASAASMDDSSTAGEAATTAAAAAGAGADAAASVRRVSSSALKQLQDPWTFSIGPRDCAGQALARLELQVVIAAVVGNFRVALGPGVGGWEGLLAKRMFHTTLQVKEGLPLLLTPRVAAEQH